MKRLDGKPRNHPGKARGPIKAKNPIVIATLEAVERSGMSDRKICKIAGIGKNELSQWRTMARTPMVERVSWVLQAIGAHVIVIDGNNKGTPQ